MRDAREFAESALQVKLRIMSEALVVDLNARVRGGRGEVRSIVAGGYNIVCRHIRVLVLEAK